jgi:acyl carrier protein
MHNLPGVGSRIQTSNVGYPTPHNRPATDIPYLAPRNELEAQLVQLWETYLSTAPIGVNDSLFSLGADSLLIIRFNAQIRARYSVELSIRNVYEMPSIAKLAEFISAANNLQQHARDIDITAALEMEEGEI